MQKTEREKLRRIALHNGRKLTGRVVDVGRSPSITILCFRNGSAGGFIRKAFTNTDFDSWLLENYPEFSGYQDMCERAEALTISTEFYRSL